MKRVAGLFFCLGVLTSAAAGGGFADLQKNPLPDNVTSPARLPPHRYPHLLQKSPSRPPSEPSTPSSTSSPETITRSGGAVAEGSWSAPDESGKTSGSTPSSAPLGQQRSSRLGSGAFLSGALGKLPPLPASSPTGSGQDDFEPGELLIASGDLQNAQAVAQAMAGAGYRLRRRRVLTGLGMILSVFRIPGNTDVMRLVEALRAQSPEVWLDANHRYRPQGGSVRYGRQLIRWRNDGRCGHGSWLGLVDGGVDLKHPAFQGRSIAVQSWLGMGEKQAPKDHGTALAALLVGAPASDYEGLLPEAGLQVEVVLRRRGKKVVDTTAEKIVAALDHLAAQGVPVALLSLGGPPNKLVELAVLLAQRKGMVLVAAAGNAGRREAVYPAAYDGVVGVTAVDAEKRRMKKASTGKQVDLAAPGVDLWVAKPGGGGTYRTGTSFAVPYVGAALVAVKGDFSRLVREAVDLGKAGWDEEYGYGLIQWPVCKERSH